MITKNYKIGKLNFSIYGYDLFINDEKPFCFFQIDHLSQFAYHCYKGIPQLAACMKLVYKDNRNIIYNNNDYFYRYIGNYVKWDIKKESQCCIVFQNDLDHGFRLYLDDQITCIGEKELFNYLGLEQLLAYQSCVILHSSYITYKNMGIVFSAPSQTGKSTQADLWQKYVSDVEIINGDRSILAQEGELIKVFGIPFCGSSEIAKNKEVNLHSIIILRQGTNNEIRKLSSLEAVKLLYSECSVPVWDEIAVTNIMKLLSEIVSRIPVYLYYCVKDVTAVEKLLATIERSQ